MRLARESRYAIEALMVLAARRQEGFVGAREIGAEAGLPLAYLHKILRLLAEAGVVLSRRGRGYKLANPPSEIRMRDVLVAVEGPDVFGGRCIFWREGCSPDNPCELHFRWKELKPVMESRIAETTLQQIVESRAASEHVS
jgi:Rrf2 family protein